MRLAVAVPFRLLTLLEVDWENQLVRRRYSSDEEHYASGGVKRLMESQWAQHVLKDGKVFTASDRSQMVSAFADHEFLFSLGLDRALNVPVLCEGRVAWTLNMLRGELSFDNAEVGAVQALLNALSST
jgi:hypothetical protein